MATKLSAEMRKRLESVGISICKSEEDAKEKALKKLEELDCYGFDGEELDTMVSILESYITDY